MGDDGDRRAGAKAASMSKWPISPAAEDQADRHGNRDHRTDHGVINEVYYNTALNAYTSGSFVGISVRELCPRHTGTVNLSPPTTEPTQRP